MQPANAPLSPRAAQGALHPQIPATLHYATRHSLHLTTG